MKHMIDKTDGTVSFKPECELDRQLLFHLMDCADLAEFSMYVENYENIANNPMTADLGVSGEELMDYPCPSQPFAYHTDLPYYPAEGVLIYSGEQIALQHSSTLTGKTYYH